MVTHTRSTTQNLDRNENADIQKGDPNNQMANVNVDPVEIQNPTDSITRAEFHNLARQLMENRRQLNQQVHTNIDLMNRINRQQRSKARRDPTSYSTSESSSSSDGYHRHRRRRTDGYHIKTSGLQQVD